VGECLLAQEHVENKPGYKGAVEEKGCNPLSEATS
jgi:hypothetical protein